MSRKSTILTHPDRRAIESALLGGDSLRDVARNFNVSVSSVHRYSSGELAEQMRDAARRIDDVQASDVLSRVLGIADDAQLLREQAVQAGNVPLAIKVSAAELRALSILSGLLGLDSGVLIDEAVDATRAAREFARGVVIAARETPAVGEAVLAALRADHSTMTADQLERILRAQAPVPALTH